MTSRHNRLERAISVYLQHVSGGSTDRAAFLAAHEDLRDLLEPMLETVPDPVAEPGGDPADRRIGPYRVIRELGRGGAGIVYEAMQPSLERSVAIKVLYAHLTEQPASVARFKREAHALARLAHDNIVKVIDHGEADGAHWLAMELIEGSSLEERIDALRQQGGHAGASLRSLVEIIATIAQALAHVHSAGVVHRDVKPGNILLRSDGTPLLGDFGLARDDDQPTLTRTGVLPGTPAYMAPERLARGVTDERGDVFALGVTLYEAIALQRPFVGATPDLVVHRILSEDAPDPRRVNRGVAADLAAIATKAMEKDPSRRYQSAADLAADLRAFLELRPVQARPLSSWHRVRRWVRREPVHAALAAVIALSLLAIAGLAGYLLARRTELQVGADTIRAGRLQGWLAEGFAQLFARHRDPGYRDAFERVLEEDPLNEEAAFALAAPAEDTPQSAIAFLDGLHPDLRARPALARWRAHLAERAGSHAAGESPPPGGDFDHTVADWIAYRRAKESGEGDAIAAAVRAFERDERRYAKPSLVHAWLWAVAAVESNDAESQADCADFVERHFWDVAPALAMTTRMHRRDPARALAVAERAAALAPGEASHQFNLAVELTRAQRLPDALAAAERAIELDSRHAPARVQRGVLLYQLGCGADAIAELEATVALWPADGFAWHNLGSIRSRLGNEAGALEAVRRAVELLPRERVVHESLLNLLERAKLDDERQAELARWRRATGQ